MAPTHRDHLATLARGTDTASALAFFDGLPAVPLSLLSGAWRGSGLPTAHPFDGLLERFGWHGKRFTPGGDAYPLVFARGGGRFVDVNPVFVPLRLVLRHARWFQHDALARPFQLLSSLLRTRAPRARLRLTEHRGVVTATMIYDAHPIHDVFRQVDADTLLGLMDLRGMEQPFFFILRRE